MESINIVPNGGTYYDKSSDKILVAGEPLPVAGYGDILTYRDYKYEYMEKSSSFTIGTLRQTYSCPYDMWRVYVIDTNKTTYEKMLTKIRDISIVNAAHTYGLCYNLVTAPALPDTITDMSYTFYCCTS